MDETSDFDRLHHPTRRSSERRLEALANNSGLKVAQFVITGVAVPLIGWGANELSAIQLQLRQQDKASAINELRMLTVEKATAEEVAANRTLRERVLTLELQVRGITTTKGRP